MKSKLLLVTLVLMTIFALPLVAAVDISVSPIMDRIPPQGIATYNISFDNPTNRDLSVTWSLSPSQAPNWIISPSAVSVPAGEVKYVTLTAIPRSVVLPSQYNLLFSFRSGSTSQDIPIPVRVVSVDSVFGFQPHISLTLDAPRSVDPRDPYTVNVIIRNQNPRNLEDLRVTIQSALFSSELIVDVPPSAEITREVQFQLDPLQAPGDYRVGVQVFYPVTNTVLSDQTSNFEVISYSDITPSFSAESSWFKVTETITMQNIGNVARNKEVALRAPWYQRIFISSSLDYEVVSINGAGNIQWNPRLEPSESLVIVVERNYRPIVFVVLLIIISVLLYFKLRSPLVVEKHAFVLKKDDEGVNDIKIRLYVKNRSKKPLYNLSVSDMLPRITEFVESNALGSVKPTKVTKTSKKGTVLNWHFDSIESLEERIITYKMRSTLRIVGDISLPTARVKFEDSEGKEAFVDSSSAKFFSKQ